MSYGISCLYALTDDITFVKGIEHVTKLIYGVQFHPEVDLSPNGIDILKNFLVHVSIHVVNVVRQKIQKNSFE